MSTIGLLNPIDFPLAWSVVQIGGVESPGLCFVTGAKREHKYDVKEGKGTKGATTTFVNLPPVKFSIKFLLWDNGTLGSGHNHFDEWDDFIPLLKYDPTKKSVQAFDIYHPALDAIDVHSVVTTSVGQIEHDGGGMYSITVEFLEYMPASKSSAVSTPNGSTPNGKPDWQDVGTGPDSAVSAAQKEAADLAKQAQKAAA